MSKRKEDQPETNDGAEDVDPEPPVKKSRGRPRIHTHTPKDPTIPKRPRGRPKKIDTGDNDKEEDDKVAEPEPAPAKRSPGKPRKQEKIVIKKSTTPVKKGRGRPKGSTKRGRGRPPKAAKAAEEEPAAEDETAEAEESS